MNESEITALEMVIYAGGASCEQLDAVVKRLRRANELETEVRKLRENAKTDLGRRIAISRRLKSPVAGEMGKVTEVLPDGFGKYVWIVELDERSSDLNTQVTEAVLRAESSNDLSDWVNLYKLEVELSKVADSVAEKQLAERGATNAKNKILALLGFDVEAARARMLKVAEAIDEGQSLIECAAIVELECNSEWEHRVMLEEQLKELKSRRFPIMGGPSVPWSMIAPHDKQARDNHDQSLERLAERGGLSPLEAICVLEDRRCRRGEMTEANVEAARVKLGELVRVWEDRPLEVENRELRARVEGLERQVSEDTEALDGIDVLTDRLEVENREMRELCEQTDQLNERARKQVEELTVQVTKLAVDNARYRVACCDLERKIDLSLLPYEAREAVRQCIFATWTDEERARPPEKCPDCHDGGACLPGGCGVLGCERCGKPCPTCGGSCEVKTGRTS